MILTASWSSSISGGRKANGAPMSGMQNQYRDSTKLMARALLHIKYGPKGKPWSLADTGLFKADDRVLDIGCGPGRFWAANAAALPPGLDLTLADQSPGLVEEALKTVGTSPWRSITGKVADVCALPFADASFDVVTAMHMLYHAPDKDRAVSEIARVLRPGGTLLATTNGATSMQELNVLSLEIFGPSSQDMGSTSFSLESGAPILRRHFRTVEVTAMTDILCVTDAADIVNYVTSFPPGEDADAATVQKFKKRLAEKMSAQNGTFPITRIAGYMVATGPI
jgi:SAM-dependent methyltransferase